MVYGEILSPAGFALKGGFSFVILKIIKWLLGFPQGWYREAVTEVEVATRPNEQGSGFAKA